MKIYMFNPENGLYLGEDFADEAMEMGSFVTPPDATTIAPPQIQTANCRHSTAGSSSGKFVRATNGPESFASRNIEAV